MAWSTLPDLPTELLLIIFRRLSADAILTVGKLCRRLNLVALPIFLHRVGLPDPNTCSVLRPFHQGYRDALTGLTLNFSTVEIKQLVCILDDDWLGPAAGRLNAITFLTRNIHRIHQLLDRLTSVGSLCLVFHSVGEKWTLRSKIVQEFIIAFLSLIRTALLKSCRSLQIIHSHQMAIETGYNFQVFDQTAPSMLQNIAHFFNRYLPWKKPDSCGPRGDGWRYQISRGRPAPALEMPLVRSRTALTNLDISSDFLVVPSFSTWTFIVMRFSCIISLSLSLPHNVTREEFHHFVFPEIAKALPQLQEIKVAFYRDDFMTTVVENLPHFQYLQKITIALSSYGSLPLTPTQTTPLHLQNLVKFTGSLEQAAYFFGSSMTCPNLKFVNIIIDFYFQKTYDHKATVDIFFSLGERFSALGVKPCVRICLSNNLDPPSPALTSRTLGEDPEGTEHLAMVAGLTLELPIIFRDNAEVEHQAEHALAWLAVFHGLEGLTLTTRRIIIDVPAREARDSALHRMITAEYPNITSFNVVDLLFDEYHYHWSNSRDDLIRGIIGTPAMINLQNKSTASCVCSDF